MTTALKNIVEKINHLSAVEQNAIGGLLAEELAWQKSYDRSQQQLSSIAAEALQEYKKGKTKPMNLK